MSFFEDIGKKVTQAGNDTTQAAKNFSEINRLNSEIKTYEKNINKLYTDLGKRYFDTCSQEPVPELKDLVDELRVNKAKIEAASTKIAEIKGIKICDNCKAEISADSLFCSACGQKIKAKEPEMPEGMQICPFCGFAMAAEAKFCVKCGTNLAKQANPSQV